MLNKILWDLLRMLFGATFIASAIFKLFPLDYFELVLVNQLGLSWHLVPWFARILILIEFAVGSAIMAGFKLRSSLYISLVMLGAFSLYLLVQILSGHGAENCGCFGELIPLDGPSSLIKNGVLMLLGGILLWKIDHVQHWTWWPASPIISVLAIPALFLIVPLPTFEADADFKLDKELIVKNDPYREVPIEQGSKTVVVMLAKCVHCAQLASLIATLDPSDVDQKLRIIILGKTDDVAYFVENNHIEDFHYARSGDSEFLRAIGGVFPTVLQLENGEVVNKWKGSAVNIALLSDLLADN